MFEALARGVCSVSCASLFIVACAPERPPRPEDEDGPPRASQAAQLAQDEGGKTGEAEGGVWFEKGNQAVIVTYPADRGVFKDTSKPEDVPEGSRGLVRIKLLEGPAAPAGQVWIANLGALEEKGRVKLEPIQRNMFEELALGEGLSSKVTLPEGIELPDVQPPGEEIIVYKTEWCGVCKQVMAYFDRKGVSYVAKDIEKDSGAAAELQAKAKAKGMKTGSVPVIDVQGELIVGFDRKRLESMI
jgi:glutaredoxin